MSDVFSGLQKEYRAAIVETLKEQDSSLLESLLASREPTFEQRVLVEDILSDEFCRHLLPDSEPTERGVLIDDALGKFLLLWPIQNE